jgi:hypothetical protein
MILRGNMLEILTRYIFLSVNHAFGVLHIYTQYYIRNTEKIITKCPSCNADHIESIPIAENEKYRFMHDTRRGITMMFF